MTDALSQIDGESSALFSSQVNQALEQVKRHEILIKNTVANVASYDQEISTLLASSRMHAEHIESVNNKVDELLEGVKKSVSDGSVAVEYTQKALILAQEANTNAQGQLEECTNAKVEAEAAAALLKGLSDKAQTVEKRIADYEARLAELEQQSKEQLKTIFGLLPGATSRLLKYRRSTHPY